MGNYRLVFQKTVVFEYDVEVEADDDFTAEDVGRQYAEDAWEQGAGEWTEVDWYESELWDMECLDEEDEEDEE
jgi:hypothetical protein